MLFNNQGGTRTKILPYATNLRVHRIILSRSIRISNPNNYSYVPMYVIYPQKREKETETNGKYVELDKIIRKRETE